MHCQLQLLLASLPSSAPLQESFCHKGHGALVLHFAVMLVVFYFAMTVDGDKSRERSAKRHCCQ